MLHAYGFIVLLVLPLALLRLLLRSVREPGYREDLPGRFGRGRAAVPGAIWVHAVSAGEVAAATPLLDRLHAEVPARPLLVTTTTATGRARARADCGASADVAWLPFDLPWCVDAFLAARRPAVLVLVETELWPVLVDRCRRRGIPVLLVNARLSERSARRYGRIGPLLRPMLGALTAILCQDEPVAERFLGLGVAPAVVRVTGSLKFEPRVPEGFADQVTSLRAQLPAEAFVLVAASTHDGEEVRLFEALGEVLGEGALLVLVPRHPQRFDSVWRSCQRSGLPAARISAGAPPAGTRVLLWDRMGDLFALCGAADLVFVGGSLVAGGGHNPIEAAWHGTPVLVGPGAFNFEEVNARLADGDGLVTVDDAAGVAAEVLRLRDDAALRQRRGAAAAASVRAAGGSLDATTEIVVAALQSPE
jgi:3-deoxy-D-manno-octulosonic-acid transferase